MAKLSGEEKHQVEAGARAFVQELQKASPSILVQGAAALGEAQPDPAFLQCYTENWAVGDEQILRRCAISSGRRR